MRIEGCHIPLFVLSGDRSSNSSHGLPLEESRGPLVHALVGHVVDIGFEARSRYSCVCATSTAW